MGDCMKSLSAELQVPFLWPLRHSPLLNSVEAAVFDCAFIFLRLPKTCLCFPSSPFSNHYTPLTFLFPFSPLLWCTQYSVWMECQYLIFTLVLMFYLYLLSKPLLVICAIGDYSTLVGRCCSVSLRLSSITTPWITSVNNHHSGSECLRKRAS